MKILHNIFWILFAVTTISFGMIPVYIGAVINHFCGNFWTGVYAVLFVVGMFFLAVYTDEYDKSISR